MSYSERLHRYEQEKTKLRMENLTEKEYEQRIKALADKWRIYL